MTDVYKKALKKYHELKNSGECYANRIILELENTEEYPLTVAEEINRIEAFLPKDNIEAKPLSDENLQDMVNSKEYSLTVDEELSHIGAFRKSLPKDNGAQSPSDESFDEMINSGEHGFFDIDEFYWVEILSNYKSNYKSKVVKKRPFSRYR